MTRTIHGSATAVDAPAAGGAFGLAAPSTPSLQESLCDPRKPDAPSTGEHGGPIVGRRRLWPPRRTEGQPHMSWIVCLGPAPSRNGLIAFSVAPGLSAIVVASIDLVPLLDRRLARGLPPLSATR